MPTSVLKYYVHSITENDEKTKQEAYEAHSYYNKLIDIGLEENRKCAPSNFVKAIADDEKAVEALEEAIKAVYAEVKKARKGKDGEKGKKLPLTDEQSQRIKSLKDEREMLRKKLAAARSAFYKTLKPYNVTFDERTSGASRELLDKISSTDKELKEAKKQRRKKMRGSAARVDALTEELKRLKKVKKDGSPSTYKKAEANLRVLREMLRDPEVPDDWKRMQRFRRRAHTQRLRARDSTSITHGAYAAVEAAVKAAFTSTAKKGKTPRFRSFDGGRKVGMQLQPTITGKAFYAGTDPRLVLVSRRARSGRKDESKRKPSQGGNRSSGEYVTVRMRIPGRLGKSKPSHVTVDAYLHRPVPPDAEITWVYLVPDRRGLRITYSLQLTINTSKPLTSHGPGKGECHVRIRWSRDPNDTSPYKGVIVAEIDGKPYALDGKEYRERNVHFNKRGGAYAGMMKERDIRGFRDMYFESNKETEELGARDRLIQWMEDNKNLVPPWMEELTEGIDRWKKHSLLDRVAKRWMQEISWTQDPPLRQYTSPRAPQTRLQELWVWWKKDRDKLRELDKNLDYMPTCRAELYQWLEKAGITDEFDRMGIWLEWWRRHDAHLTQYAGDIGRKARANRRDQYSRKAAELARKYERVIIHTADLADAAKRKDPGEDLDEMAKHARDQRTCAAPSEFVSALKAAFGAGRWEVSERSECANAAE